MADHSGRSPIRTSGLLVAMAVLLVLAPAIEPAGATTTGASPVATQVPGDDEVAQATLTSVAPAIATGQDTLTLSGTVRNVGADRLRDPLPVLRWSSDPVQNPDELDIVTENPLFRYGRVDYRYSGRIGDLDPGEAADFTIDVPLDELEIATGVYVFGFDVLATLPDGLRVFVASARTTVPVGIEVERTLPVAVLWPLVDVPSLLPDQRLADDRLVEQISAGGRLHGLMAAGTNTDVTWVVDPDLVATTQVMAGGYTTAQPPASEGGQEAATAFLDDLVDLAKSGADVWRIPAADPDVGGALASGIESDVLEQAISSADALLATEEALGTSVPSLVMLTDRSVNTRMLGTYLRAGVDTVVLPVASVRPAPSAPKLILARPKGRDVPAVLTVPPPKTPPEQQVSATTSLRQAILSQTALLATASDAPSAVVLAPELRWAPDRPTASTLLSAWAAAPWVDAVTLAEIPVTSDQVTLQASVASPALPEEVMAGIAGLQEDAERLEPLFAEPPLSPETVPTILLREVSHAWRDAPEDGLAYLDAVRTTVTDAEDKLGLVLADSITLSSRSGRFPITVVNESTSDVLVGVRFTSQNTSRLRVEDIEPAVITAGEKRTDTVTALATANGRVQVRATLVTSEGETVAESVDTIVDVTDVGALGWTVIALGATLMVAALTRARLRARASTKEQP